MTVPGAWLPSPQPLATLLSGCWAPPCLLPVPLLLQHIWVGVAQGLIAGTCSCPRVAPTRVKNVYVKGFSRDGISFHCIIFWLCDLKRKRSER